MPRISITREYMYGTNAGKYEAVSSNFEEEHIAVIACPACRNAIFVNQDHIITIEKNAISVTPDIHCRRCDKGISIEKGILTMIETKPTQTHTAEEMAQAEEKKQKEDEIALQKQMEERQAKIKPKAQPEAKKPKEKPIKA